MSKTLKVTTDNTIQVIDVDFDDFRSIQHAVGGWAESVFTKQISKFFGGQVLLLVDEEGRFKGLLLNPAGSWLYGTPVHGYPIVGDFILACIRGEDFVAPDNLEEIKTQMMEFFHLKEADHGSDM